MLEGLWQEIQFKKSIIVKFRNFVYEIIRKHLPRCYHFAELVLTYFVL